MLKIQLSLDQLKEWINKFQPTRHTHTTWWHSHRALLGFVNNGAEAMDWDVQDPPRSYGDLEGAWWVWKEGGSASPMVGDEDED